ncbi:hypothetical protein HBA54_04080 [Pelagibius litoralis]|uniref:Uncharacterized protein n=1 Tax=Pelagibius litoralis TaxID=374515 RepID=A0A967EX53_9PROT|nr:hypothetical protein [Pelagibius litoralis]NIA67760.1 hypothetical protein [Pelagibius litoralis]
MFTKYDKAAAGAIAAALTGVLAAVTTLDPDVVAAIGTLATAFLVYLVPNKGASA